MRAARISRASRRGLAVDWLRRRRLEQVYLEALAGAARALAISPEERALMLEGLSAIDAMLDSLGECPRQILLMA